MLFGIIGGVAGPDGVQTNCDNVRLDAVLVPEPSTALLGDVGLLALLRRR